MALSSAIPIFRSECPPQVWMVEEGLQQVFFELTGYCNNRCPGCINESFIENFASRKFKPGFHHQPLTKEKWVSVLEKLPKSVKAIVLSGGEPTLHTEFFSIINEIDKRGYQFTIFTNGRWPNPEGLIKILSGSKNFNGFLISLHGTTASSHEAFSGQSNSFAETVGNIRKASIAKLPITVSTVITCQNLDELNQLPMFAKELGAEAISFNRYLHAPSRILGDAISPPTPEQLKNAIQIIEHSRDQYNGLIHIGYGPTIPHCFEESSSLGCSAGDASLVIDPWGNVKPCLHVNLLCGNITQDDFDSIWNNSNLKTWRNLALGSCGSCTTFSSCGGGCRAMLVSWGSNQDPLMNSDFQGSFVRLNQLTSK